jgi:hypothetical protein
MILFCEGFVIVLNGIKKASLKCRLLLGFREMAKILLIRPCPAIAAKREHDTSRG